MVPPLTTSMKPTSTNSQVKGSSRCAPDAERWRFWAIAGFCLLASLTLSLGCAAVPGIDHARNGHFAEFRKAERSSKQDYSKGQLRRLARAVLSGEVKRASDREDRPFVASLVDCGRPVARALRSRSQQDDGVGAEAAMVLLESGRLGDRPKKYATDQDGGRRALAARASKRRGAARRAFFVDPDERVRRAALRAALDAQDAADASNLLEVARLDPDGTSRQVAIFALANFGGNDLVEALWDRFEGADESLRRTIVEAWGKQDLYRSGGQERLARVIAQRHGLASVEAAAILSRDPQVSVKNSGLTRLLRFSREGSSKERIQAISSLSLADEGVVPLLLELSEDDATEVALAANARLLDSPSKQKAAEKRLLAAAKEENPHAVTARAWLAAAGRKSVHALLLKQAKSKDGQHRLAAAKGLLQLQASSELIPLLADPVPEVRRTLACEVLSKKGQAKK